MAEITLPANYYQQFDADATLEIPGESYGGWQRAEIKISREHTALVVMHAWDGGTPKQYPGWHRAVEYLQRAGRICREIFPPLLSAARAGGLPVFHVVGGGSYYQSLPGYQRAVALSGEPHPSLPQIQSDLILDHLRQWKQDNAFVGRHNLEDVRRAYEVIDFVPEASPLDSEGIAENTDQLFALCHESGTNHLIYCGFAINWCLVHSPGGMVDMTRRGLMCSALRQAVTAVENKETARRELCKDIALWQVAVGFGFVFDVEHFIVALQPDTPHAH